MIDFAERDVPADVRARITDTVHRGMAEPARHSLRMPLIVAASVAAVVVAGLVAVLTVHDRSSQVPARPTPTPSPTSAPAPKSSAADELDRCWAAVVAEGKQADFPARSKWTTVQRQPSTSANVTAVRGGGKTFFCMTTRATVAVSDPKAKVTPVPGTGIRVMVADDNGWVLGTMSDSDKYVTIDTSDGGVGVEPTNGVFLIHMDAMSDLESRVHVQLDAGNQAIPAVPAPAVERTDRPLPAPDRTSTDGKRLGECLDKAGWPKSYADQWQPLASTSYHGSYGQTANSAGQLGVCYRLDNRYTFIPLDPVPPNEKPQEVTQGFSVPYGNFEDTRMFVMGTVPRAAKTMAATLADGTTHDAAVRDGVWVLAIPAGDAPTSVLVKDAAGKVLYEGEPVEITEK